MLDIKAWLGGSGEPVADTCFPPGEAPGMPYIVFLDHVQRGGVDLSNLLRRHSLTIERYSETEEDNESLEGLFDEQALEFAKEKQWLFDEGCYLTTYNLQTDLVERG